MCLACTSSPHLAVLSAPYERALDGGIVPCTKTSLGKLFKRLKTLLETAAGPQDRTSNMNARASLGRCSGQLLSFAMALSKVAVSGPCGVMQTCRLAPACSTPASPLSQSIPATAQAPTQSRALFIQPYRKVFHSEQDTLILTYTSAKLTSRHEASLLCFIGAFDEAHELCHHIAVIVGWPEGVVCNCPARREDHKVCGGSACTVVGYKPCATMLIAASQAIGRV